MLARRLRSGCCLLVLVLLAHRTPAASAQAMQLSADQLDSVAALNAHIGSAGTPAGRSVGFLSQGNYESVHTILHSMAEPVIYTGTAELIAAVEAGEVAAGLMSGLPQDPANKLHVFGSGLVSPRAALFQPGSVSDDLLDAVDAAIVRIYTAGTDVALAEANAPFEMVAVHTCKANQVDHS